MEIFVDFMRNETVFKEKIVRNELKASLEKFIRNKNKPVFGQYCATCLAIRNICYAPVEKLIRFKCV